jgi:hypothetical protein
MIKKERTEADSLISFEKGDLRCLAAQISSRKAQDSLEEANIGVQYFRVLARVLLVMAGTLSRCN